MVIRLLLSNQRTICTTEPSLCILLTTEKSQNNFNSFTTCVYCATTTEGKPEACQTPNILKQAESYRAAEQTTAGRLDTDRWREREGGQSGGGMQIT